MPTRREILAEYLIGAELTPRELADLTERKVKEVLDDLEHVRQSYKRAFKIKPAECNRCGYLFERRARLNTPSRCPECRAERIRGPWLWIDTTE